MVRRHLDHATFVAQGPIVEKGVSSAKGPEPSERRHLRLWEIIIMSRYCEGMRRIIKRLTGQDNHDHHHRRKGEEDREGIRHQEQEPNDIDKKTRPTISTMTSSIKIHILDCAISQKPYVYSVFLQSVFYKKNKLGPDNNI